MARRRLGIWRRFAVMLVKPVMTGWTRRTWRGMEHLAGDRGIIIAANHLSHADPLVLAHYIYDAGRWPRFLGKASVFRVPGVGWLLHRCRQIPVERGTVDAVRSLDKLVNALQAGGAVVIYPEGTTTREPHLWPMQGKTGVARLALATGAPVIPVAMWGPEKMFDPRTKKLGLRPRLPVTVVAGPPVDLNRWTDAEPTKTTLDEMTDAIMLRLRDMLADLRGETPPPLWSRTARTANGTPPASSPSVSSPSASTPPASASPAAAEQRQREDGTANTGLGGVA